MGLFIFCFGVSLSEAVQFYPFGFQCPPSFVFDCFYFFTLLLRLALFCKTPITVRCLRIPWQLGTFYSFFPSNLLPSFFSNSPSGIFGISFEVFRLDPTLCLTLGILKSPPLVPTLALIILPPFHGFFHKFQLFGYPNVKHPAYSFKPLYSFSSKFFDTLYLFSPLLVFAF